jgi:hypothetical protein
MDITKDEALAIISKTDPRHEKFYGATSSGVERQRRIRPI